MICIDKLPGFLNSFSSNLFDKLLNLLHLCYLIFILHDVLQMLSKMRILLSHSELHDVQEKLSGTHQAEKLLGLDTDLLQLHQHVLCGATLSSFISGENQAFEEEPYSVREEYARF
jgi:hypothetical protein